MKTTKRFCSKTGLCDNKFPCHDVNVVQEHSCPYFHKVSESIVIEDVDWHQKYENLAKYCLSFPRPVEGKVSVRPYVRRKPIRVKDGVYSVPGDCALPVVDNVVSDALGRDAIVEQFGVPRSIPGASGEAAEGIIPAGYWMCGVCHMVNPPELGVCACHGVTATYVPERDESLEVVPTEEKWNHLIADVFKRLDNPDCKGEIL